MTTSESSANTAFSAVVREPLLARLTRVSEIPAEKLAITLLVVAIAEPDATVAASVTVTVEDAASTTSVASVTRAAVTSAVVPLTV